MEMFKLLLVSLTVLCAQVESARILCIFPIPSISHQVVFRAYTDELAKLGHELVIVTPDPYLPKDRPKDNVTEIDVSFSYKFFRDMMEKFAKQKQYAIRGVALKTDSVDSETFTPMLEVYKQQLNLPAVKEIINDPKQHFDLLVVEAFVEYPLIVSSIVKAPIIAISSCYGTPENYNMVGAVSRHPVYYPSFYRSYFGISSLWDRILAIYREYNYYKLYVDTDIIQNNLLKKEYGPDAPSVKELRDKVDLLFLNTHPILDYNRPVPPNVVYLGSLHLKPVKKLPEDIEKYMNDSKNGVVYISFGTNAQPTFMDKDLLESILKAIEALPYDVLWKYDGELENKPKNLMTFKWMPQRDLLHHPKIKLFVTQGGRQSLDEAIDATVPMVGIPMLGDQWYNVKKSVELGICKQILVEDLTTNNFLEAMLTVIDDKTYKKNLEELRSVIEDQAVKPIERAIWWTEYLLRHGGAKHLKSPLANITWSEYLMLDVVAAVAATVVAAIAFMAFIVCYIVTVYRKKVKIDEKKRK